MIKFLWTGLAASLLALPCRAQVEAPRPAEVLPPPAPSAACGYVEKCKTSYQLHWLEREVPCTVTTMKLREVVTPDTKPSLEIEYKKEQQTRPTMVLKPQEVVKEVTICTQKPRVVKDPCTGCSTVVFEPVTETKKVTEITYCLVPEEKVVTVETGCLKSVEIPIARRTMVLDCTTENVIKKERFGVLVPVEITERKPVCPCPQPCAK